MQIDKKEKKQNSCYFAKHLKMLRNGPLISLARCQWLTPVIPATQAAEISRTTDRSQLGQIVLETPS
jgi:hypothetical protein